MANNKLVFFDGIYVRAKDIITLSETQTYHKNGMFWINITVSFSNGQVYTAVLEEKSALQQFEILKKAMEEDVSDEQKD